MRSLLRQRAGRSAPKRSLVLVSLCALAALALISPMLGLQAPSAMSAAVGPKVTAPAAQPRPEPYPAGQPASTWVRTFGGSEPDEFQDIIATSDGGFATVGITVSFGRGAGDLWAIKFDSSGNPVWQNTYGGPQFDGASAVASASLIATADGGFLATGATHSFSAGGADAWVLKLDASGAIQWQRSFGGNDLDDFRAAAQTTDGGFVLAGTTSSFGAGFADAWVVKLNAQGNTVWQRTYGLPNADTGQSVAATPDGGAVVAGLTDDGSRTHAWLFRLDPNGNVVWQKSYEGNGTAAFRKIVATGDGGFAASGGTATPGTGQLAKGWVVKLDSSGNIQWQKTYASPDTAVDSGSVSQTSDGSYVVSFLATNSTFTRADGWVLRLDSQGNLTWGKAFGAPGGLNFLWSVTPAGDGGFAAVGRTAAFGAGQQDGWQVKMDANGDVSACTVGSPITPAVAASTGPATDTSVTPANTTVTALTSNATVASSAGEVSVGATCGPPLGGPPAGPTSTPVPGATATPTPTATTTPPATTPDEVCPPTAPFFPETGYCIDNPQIAEYFQARGGVDTFGLPASRTFRLLGFTAQVFQRHILRVHPDGVKPMNLLDPDVLPVTTVNFATFPTHDPGLATSAPPPNTPNYSQAVLSHLQANVPNSFEGVNVQFLTAYLAAAEGAGVSGDAAALVALEIWGFPTSRPARDPNNSSFIYQRFQRGILHSFPDPNNPANRVSRGILLADNLKFVLTNDQVLLPSDLRGQVQQSRFFNQYCPNSPSWVCRPAQLPDSDLTRAFQTQRR